MEFIISPATVGACAQEVVRLWNICLGDAFPLDETLFRQQVLPGQDASLLLIARRDSDGVLAGVVLAKLWSEVGQCVEGRRSTGYISFILVAPSERNKGLGGKLLDLAEGWCRDRGASSVRLGSDNRHFFPGLPMDNLPRSVAASTFFSKRGYVLDRIESDLIADLAVIDLPSSPEAAFSTPGYHFSLCSRELRPAVLAFLSRAFPGRWYREISEAFAVGMADEDLALALRDGAPVGFARLCTGASAYISPGLFWRSLLGASPGALGPIGVDPSCRGQGVGIGLLRGSLAALKGRGIRNTVIDWTSLVEFYGKLGFAPWKQYACMGKPLGSRADGSIPAHDRSPMPYSADCRHVELSTIEGK
jgi:GNAT superfamily N-acetyltransferase